MNSQSPSVHVGVDVAKSSLQVFLQGVQIETGNCASDHTKLCKQLKKVAQPHVICEATGGYERSLVEALHKAKIPVSVINPTLARAAARAKGQRAKNDRIDARELADYGKRYQPEPTPKVSRVQKKLAHLTQWLKQLIDLRAQTKTYGEHHADQFVKKQHEALLGHLAFQIKKVEAQITDLMAGEKELKNRVDCLTEIKGVGLRTAWVVLAQMPELGAMNRQQVAALAGLAPWAKDSGTMKGVRCISGGRFDVRRALYMSALCASRCNPVLSKVYKNLIDRDKLHKVALTAVMRKLIIYMNARLKDLALRKFTAEELQTN
jgi:transposase